MLNTSRELILLLTKKRLKINIKCQTFNRQEHKNKFWYKNTLAREETDVKINTVLQNSMGTLALSEKIVKRR